MASKTPKRSLEGASRVGLLDWRIVGRQAYWAGGQFRVLWRNLRLFSPSISACSTPFEPGKGKCPSDFDHRRTMESFALGVWR